MLLNKGSLSHSLSFSPSLSLKLSSRTSLIMCPFDHTCGVTYHHGAGLGHTKKKKKNSISWKGLGFPTCESLQFHGSDVVNPLSTDTWYLLVDPAATNVGPDQPNSVVQSCSNFKRVKPKDHF